MQVTQTGNIYAEYPGFTQDLRSLRGSTRWYYVNWISVYACYACYRCYACCSWWQVKVSRAQSDSRCIRHSVNCTTKICSSTPPQWNCHCVWYSCYLTVLAILWLIIIVFICIVLAALIKLSPIGAIHDADSGHTSASVTQCNIQSYSYCTLPLRVFATLPIEQHWYTFQRSQEASWAWMPISNHMQVRITLYQYLPAPSLLSCQLPIASLTSMTSCRSISFWVLQSSTHQRYHR